MVIKKCYVFVSCQLERQSVEDLHIALQCAKFKYRSALSNLENISEEIHKQRKKRLNLPPRTPGVGAEADDKSDLPSIHLGNIENLE